MTTETQSQTMEQDSPDVQNPATQETPGKSSQTGQPKENKSEKTLSSDELAELRGNAFAEGQRKAMKEVAKKAGYSNPDDINFDEIKGAVEAKRAAEEANKTAEEKLAALSGELEKYKGQAAEALKIVSDRVEQDFKGLPESAQKFVSEFAGDDPMARMKYMSSESFSNLLGETGKRTQGGIKNTPDAAVTQEAASFEKDMAAFRAETDPRKRAEMASKLQGRAKSRAVSGLVK